MDSLVDAVNDRINAARLDAERHSIGHVHGKAYGLMGMSYERDIVAKQLSIPPMLAHYFPEYPL